MVPLFHPCPIFPVPDAIDGSVGNAKSFGYLSVGKLAKERSYLKDIFFRKLGPVLPLSAQACSVRDAVLRIFDGSSPSQVLRVAASLMPLAAGMRGLVLRARRWSIDYLTDKPRDEIFAPFIENLPVAVADTPIGPRQTLIAHKRENGFSKVAKMVTFGCPPALGITIADPSLVMGIAPATAAHWLVAIRNRAYGRSSHFDLLSGWLVRTRRDVSASGGFAICTRQELTNQQVRL